MYWGGEGGLGSALCTPLAMLKSGEEKGHGGKGADSGGREGAGPEGCKFLFLFIYVLC